VRFQYSAFHGRLTRNRREELALSLESLIEIYGGSIALIPVCAADCEGWINVYVEPPPIEAPRLVVHRGAADDRAAADSAE
jgi:CRISPR/Cas system-associated endoribonuclease Cas2